MRCRVCDEVLTDHELTRKDANSGDFLDTCTNCLRAIREALSDFDEPPYRHDAGVDNEDI